MRAWIGNGVALLLVALGVLFFFMTKDPMILIFALVAAAIALVIANAARLRPPQAEVVRVRCRECSGLNPEAARHCMACGRPL